ncbi:MAG TPA: ergothioneine biosynthesis protein EgtB [Polyangia bacterium]|nr:ergothioneine biosynthesis protein EgtB [Polyangia bacterium]
MSLGDRYQAIRQATDELCRPLSAEDCGVQSMADASPVKWHLAHTSWFFETFVLESAPGYRVFHPSFRTLFNSYYNAVGDRHARPARGLLSRPALTEIQTYRRHVDQAMARLLDDEPARSRVGGLVVLGLNHEQQHQELILTDIKHAFWMNPLRPAYAASPERPAPDASATAAPLSWREHAGGLVEIGAAATADPGASFAFDNEGPRHAVVLRPHALATRLTTCGEYQAFMADGGYRRPELWLSDGWDAAQAGAWQAPLYWEQRHEGRWWWLTFAGMQPVAAADPVTHLSYYEADAYARWAGARLPTEAEWEVAAAPRATSGSAAGAEGNLLESGWLRPLPAAGSAVSGGDVAQLFGDVWEWTQSPYTPYPGFRAAPGALGEYNGKFMCNQMVLRGGSCLTPRSHIRASYRNFFAPAARWQMSGLRLARDT